MIRFFSTISFRTSPSWPSRQYGSTQPFRSNKMFSFSFQQNILQKLRINDIVRQGLVKFDSKFDPSVDVLKFATEIIIVSYEMRLMIETKLHKSTLICYFNYMIEQQLKKNETTFFIKICL
jgi:hypothetical protein